VTGTIPVVFAGPSVAGASPEGVELRGPAAAGDLLALIKEPPRTVALIDGVFDELAAVQHKEILELLAATFRVLGASSMGALRAAELDRFGMIGIGGVYRAFAAGRLNADDEVALLHAPSDWGYRPLTLPLVDARASLIAAVHAGVLSADAARAIRHQARQCFWQERTWGTVLDWSRESLDAATLEAFARWLPTGAVSIKANDAALCIAAARLPALATKAPPPRPPRTAFYVGLAAKHGITLPDSRIDPQPRMSSSPSV
jgi:hypothetical protein